MYEQYNNSTYSIRYGLAIGCVSGILIAPDTGYKTRRKIKRQGQRIVSDVQDIVSDLQDKINVSKDKLVDLKVELVNNGNRN